MTHKILFSDIDGTLLNSQHEVSSETKRAIQSLPNDFPFVLVSARMPKGIIHLHKELNLKTPIICYSGALVIDVANDASYQVILNKTMKLNYSREIYQQAKMRNLHISFYKNDDWFIEDMDDWAIQEEEIAKTNPTVIDYQELFRLWEHTKSSANKILCMGEEGEIESLERSLNNNFAGELTIYRSKPTYLEIMDNTVTKTSAIRFLLERFNIKQREMIAIGDNFNDIDMLQYAEIGVAMGNAPEQVKQVANEITSSNDDNGVAKVIQKYIL
jgi:Cof subfamily protein (haloacid dehalogenase superfamily)